MVYVIKESAVIRPLISSAGTVRVLAGTRVFKTVEAAEACMGSNTAYEIFAVRAQWSDVEKDSQDSGKLKKDKPLASIDSCAHTSIDLEGEEGSMFDDGGVF